MPTTRIQKDESIKECFEKFGESGKANCELELCIGKKMGNIADDGTIDKNALAVKISENYKDRPELLENIKKNCINGDVKDYGPEGLCEIKKISHCLHVQFMMSCPEFDDKEQCSGLKELAEKCAAA